MACRSGETIHWLKVRERLRILIGCSAVGKRQSMDSLKESVTLDKNVGSSRYRIWMRLKLPNFLTYNEQSLSQKVVEICTSKKSAASQTHPDQISRVTNVFVERYTFLQGSMDRHSPAAAEHPTHGAFKKWMNTVQTGYCR